jgi:transposase
MKTIAVVGLDLAKSVFQIHAIDADGKVVVRRQLRRGEVLKFFGILSPCLVGMEACASAHHWARELVARGHEVRLMPPAYVKPYVKRGKTDAADAEAIAEAATRPTMRFVAIKTVDQQAVLMLHKTRDLLVRQRTMLINALRGHLAEYGIIAAKGPGGVSSLIAMLHEAQGSLPPLARSALHGIAAQLSPATVPDADKPLRREVAMAYRTRSRGRALAPRRARRSESRLLPGSPRGDRR